LTRHLSEVERRAQILRAARAIFIERGYLAARVEDVAKRANLSKGAVYFYFDSKRAIFDALVEEEHAVTIGFLEEADRDTRPAAVKLVDLGRKYLDYFAGLKTPPRFFLLMSEMAIRDEDIRRRVNASTSASWRRSRGWCSRVSTKGRSKRTTRWRSGSS
jgi:AcrR family transcriptional regulator